jgi:hypothetical protein
MAVVAGALRAVEGSQETIMQTSSLIRIVQRVAALAALAGGVSAAQAGGVYWAVNVDAPSHGGGRVGTTISNSPRGLYGAAPVIIAPPVVVAPQPVYHVGHPGYHSGPRHAHGHHHRWWAGKHRYHRGYHHGYREGYRDGRDDDRGWDRRGHR